MESTTAVRASMPPRMIAVTSGPLWNALCVGLPVLPLATAAMVGLLAYGRCRGFSLFGELNECGLLGVLEG